jgi:hypothetical protein
MTASHPDLGIRDGTLGDMCDPIGHTELTHHRSEMVGETLMYPGFPPARLADDFSGAIRTTIPRRSLTE